MDDSTFQLEETEHGRLRRTQRGIDQRDLLAAKQYGKKQRSHDRPNGNPTAIYEYNGITYVVDEVTGEEVTCWAKTVELKPVQVSPQLQGEHDKAKAEILNDISCWTTNTVFVVDTSGSMSTSDVWGARTRLGAVWLSIAIDFVAQRLESGLAGPTDVVSIVALGESPRVIIQEWPCTWLLYNKLVNIHNYQEVSPRGHGPYTPSLTIAEKLLSRNSYATCIVSLFFLSDGVPSDAHAPRVPLAGSPDYIRAVIAAQMENVAKKYGPRLTFTAVGIGDVPRFDTLERMVDAAKDYGANAEFVLPSMHTSALGEVMTRFATAMTTTQNNMTCVATQGRMRVRCVSRESRRKADETINKISLNDFWLYPASQVRRWAYREWFEGREKKAKFEPKSLQHPDAKYVAMSKGSFDEGKERCVYRFFEVGSDATSIVGPPLVAKESRLILEKNKQGGEADEAARKHFVRTFCSTQQLARRLGDEFNAKMDQINAIHPETPRVSFLDCSIYELYDDDLGQMSVLVEEKINHRKWQKWNNNDGAVKDNSLVPRFVLEREMICSEPQLEGQAKIDMIHEEREDDEEEVEACENESGEASKMDETALCRPIIFSASEVAQAFSHFTYVASGRKRLVCDLQGVFDESAHILRFTDPVIHYHNPYRADRRRVHGNTDRGETGVQQFFATHRPHHGHLCRLMTRGFRKSHYRSNNSNSNDNKNNS